MRASLLLIAAIFSLGTPCALSQAQHAQLGEILSKPISVERNAAVSSVPLRLSSEKIYLPAKINDFESEFIFDTGSPTVLDKSIADQLDLKTVGESKGRDANGKIVSMTIAIADTIEIGETVFRDVPVMVHDFENMPLAKCHIPNGVIGSELLPNNAWRLNTAKKTLEIAASVEAFAPLPDTKSAPLNLFGYPYAPIIDYSIGRFSDKALFDTGNAARVSLFAEIAKDKAVRKLIDRETVQEGKGRHGVSAGGVGEILPLKRFQLKSLHIGENNLGQTQVQARPIPPTLIGAGLLDSHIVTLDYPNARFLMSPFEDPIVETSRSSFALMVGEAHVEIVQIFDGSNAQKAGLEVGDQVVAIDGADLPVSNDQERCETSLWLSNEFDADTVKTLKIERDGQVIDLAL